MDLFRKMKKYSFYLHYLMSRWKLWNYYSLLSDKFIFFFKIFSINIAIIIYITFYFFTILGIAVICFSILIFFIISILSTSISSIIGKFEYFFVWIFLVVFIFSEINFFNLSSNKCFFLIQFNFYNFDFYKYLKSLLIFGKFLFYFNN